MENVRGNISRLNKHAGVFAKMRQSQKHKQNVELCMLPIDKPSGIKCGHGLYQKGK